MTQVDVKIKNAQGLGKEILKEVEKMIHEIGNDILNESQENLIQKDEAGHVVTDRGSLLQSARIEFYAMGATVHYDAEHADFIEFGTGPHKMPIRPLQRWARRKLGLSEKESWRAAYAIRSKISKEGTDPKHFLRDAVSSAQVKYGPMGIMIESKDLTDNR